MAQLKNLIVNGAARVIGKLKATSIAGDGSEITNINAGNISSGTLPVARGGTGGSDASTVRTNLGLATAYSHAGSDTGKALSAGLYKITTSARGHVTDGTAVAKSDITALGIPAQDTVYTHPTSSGNKHIPSGGSSGQILRWSADGTAAWGADNNTTYSASNGISLSGTTFSNSGVRSIATGGTNGTISVNTNGSTANVAVKGLGSAAYTNSSAYAASSHSHSYITSQGAKNPQTGRTQAYGNVYSYNTNANANTGAPATYTSVIGFGQGASGTVEIAGGWTAGMGLWYRALRDCEDNWYSWTKIYTAKDKPTPADIGAAASNHTHTKSQITDFPASLKNPNSLTIKLNGSSQGAYDGSAAKEINITASGVGAAASSHNHGAGNITSGTLDAARIPNLAASKITSGTLAVARGGTASGTIGCLSNGQIAYNIGIRAGTSAPSASGTAGLIYIQYA